MRFFKLGLHKNPVSVLGKTTTK